MSFSFHPEAETEFHAAIDYLTGEQKKYLTSFDMGT